MKKRLIILMTIIFMLFIQACSFNNEHISKNKEANNSIEITKEQGTSTNNEINNIIKKYKLEESFILIVKKHYTLYAVNEQGDILVKYPCALGKNEGQKYREGDMKTPEGVFLIDEIIDASTWTHDFKDGKGEIIGAYGPWFISLDTSKLSNGKWGGIGIHGTHDPSSIGKNASEGCIRLKNEDLKDIKSFAKVGMKVIIEK